MKKIAHVFSHFNIGGAQTMLADIMNVQVRTCKVTLFVLLDDINEALLESLDNRIKIVLLKRHIGSKNYYPYIKLNFLLNLGGYDVVHVHEITIWNQLFLAPWVRRFQTVHNTGLFSKYFKQCVKIFAISKSVQNGLLQKGYPNVVLASNGIDCKLIDRRTNAEAHPTTFRVVQVSRLIIDHKGQDLLIEALSKLKAKGELPNNLVLDFIGEGKDMQRLKDMVKDEKLETHVHFLGQKDRNYVYAHLKDYDLFVQPSRYEGFGLTVAEAMMAGIPVLVSRNEGPFEIIGKGKYGFSFENGSSDDLTVKLHFILNNYQLALDKAKAGIVYIQNNYNVEKTAQTYLDYYLS